MMFLNKRLLKIFLKFSKYKLESRLVAFPFLLGAKAVCHLNFPKCVPFGSTKINGFQETFSLHRKLPITKANGRNMSQFPYEKCWKCQEILKIKDFACSLCGALQHPKPDVNFFQLLGISQMYDLNSEELSKNFRNLQMIFHPDKFTNKSKEELEISEAYSRLLNKAYTTLKDPSSRGFYLLGLQNISADSHPLQQDFLINMMEKNEELEAIDKTSVLMNFMKENNEEIAKHINLINEAFRAHKLESAKINLLKLNYLVNLDNKIKEKQNIINNISDK